MSKRSLLLPPYLDTNQTWIDYVSGIDTIWYDQVDLPIKALRNLRQTYLIPTVTEQKILKHQMIDSVNELDRFEREVMIRQLNLLGLPLTNTDLFNEDDLERPVRNVGRYWYGKGTLNFIDFIGFCI